MKIVIDSDKIRIRKATAKPVRKFKNKKKYDRKKFKITLDKH